MSSPRLSSDSFSLRWIFLSNRHVAGFLRFCLNFLKNHLKATIGKVFFVAFFGVYLEYINFTHGPSPPQMALGMVKWFNLGAMDPV